MKKVENNVLIEIYNQTKSVWRTAELVGLCGQSVHERLVRLNKINKRNIFTEEDYEELKIFYSMGFLKGDNELDKFAQKMGRTKQFISRKAKELGLTNAKRGETRERVERRKEDVKKIFKEKGHPKGMKGKHHSVETKIKLSEKNKDIFKDYTKEEMFQRTKKILETKFKNGNTILRKNVSWKQGYRTISGKKYFFRSSWEYNFALYLNYIKNKKYIKNWYFESDVIAFDKEKIVYIPDFKIIKYNDDIIYIEIKGWMDERSKLKIKKMKEHMPNKLKIIDSKKYNLFAKKWKYQLDGWEI